MQVASSLLALFRRKTAKNPPRKTMEFMVMSYNISCRLVHTKLDAV